MEKTKADKRQKNEKETRQPKEELVKDKTKHPI